MVAFLIGVAASVVGAIVITLGTLIWRGRRDGVGLRGLVQSIRLVVFHSGITFFYPDRQTLVKYRAPVDVYVLTAARDVTYVGFWLSAALEQGNFASAVEELAYSGRTFTACLLNPESDRVSFYAEAFGISETEIHNRIEASVSKIRAVASGLGISHQKYITICLHDKAISASVFILDKAGDHRTILVDHKLHGLARDLTYGMEFKGQKSNLANRFAETYLAIAADSREITLP